MVALSLIYLVVASGIMVWRQVSVSPDYIFLLMVPVALLAGRLTRFLRDWVPFIAILLGWEAMRGIAPKLGVAPHVGDLAHLETGLFFGHLPTSVLQSWVGAGALHTVGLIATATYFSHFALPLAVGLVLWLSHRTQFLRFTTALMGMAFAAFIIYLLAPTAPPWYAQDQGAICCFNHIIYNLFQELQPHQTPIYQLLNPNQVAAFPSLHAAFPFLAFLAVRGVYPRAAWIVLGWCFIIWFSVVFLGEHYVVDVLGGIVLATLAWTAMMRLAVPRIRLFQVPPTVAASDVVAEVT